MHGRSPQARTLLARMMERSELRLSEAARHEEGFSRQAATRVLESTHAFREWEGTHSQLMRGIAGLGRVGKQVQAVRRMGLSMIHRKAPFEYLRDQHVCGAGRHVFFDLIYGEHDFARSVVREHRNYLNSFCSYLCVESFCAPTSMHWIHEYEKTYTNYWQAHASYRLGRVKSAEAGRDIALLQYLRDDLEVARRRVLGTAPSRADELTLEELRRPTGDTVRLRIPRRLHRPEASPA